MDLTPFRPHDLTPWRSRVSGRVVETVSMTRVEVTRSRAVEGRVHADDWVVDERQLNPVAEARPTLRTPYREARVEEPAAFVHAAMTPLPTEGFLSLWADRHRGDTAPRRAAAAFNAYERAR